MVAARQAKPDRLARAILQQQALVVAKHGISERRFDADACRTAREDQASDTETSESLIKLGLIEAAIPVLRYEDVSFSWRKLRQDRGIPRVLDENAARSAIRSSHRISHRQRSVFDPGAASPHLQRRTDRRSVPA